MSQADRLTAVATPQSAQSTHRCKLESGLDRLTPAERAERGKEARAAVPRESHAEFDPGPGRPDPIDLLEEQAKSRVPELVPIRRGRMMVSPFTYYRGAADGQRPFPDAGVRAGGAGVRGRAPVELRHFRLSGPTPRLRRGGLRSPRAHSPPAHEMICARRELTVHSKIKSRSAERTVASTASGHNDALRLAGQPARRHPPRMPQRHAPPTTRRPIGPPRRIPRGRPRRLTPNLVGCPAPVASVRNDLHPAAATPLPSDPRVLSPCSAGRIYDTAVLLVHYSAFVWLDRIATPTSLSQIPTYSY